MSRYKATLAELNEERNGNKQMNQAYVEDQSLPRSPDEDAHILDVELNPGCVGPTELDFAYGDGTFTVVTRHSDFRLFPKPTIEDSDEDIEATLENQYEVLPFDDDAIVARIDSEAYNVLVPLASSATFSTPDTDHPTAAGSVLSPTFSPTNPGDDAFMLETDLLGLGDELATEMPPAKRRRCGNSDHDGSTETVGSQLSAVPSQTTLTRKQAPAAVLFTPVYDDKPKQPPLSPLETMAESSTTWFWRPILLLAATLHLFYQVSHRAVDIMLQVIQQIFIQLGALQSLDDSPVTLRTAIKRISLQDRFCVLAMCTSCKVVYSASDSAADAECPQCSVRIFKEVPTTPIILVDGLSCSDGTGIFTRRRGRGGPKATTPPVLQTPCALPSELIADLINSSPSMEAELDKWRIRSPQTDNLTCIQDGRIWKTLPGPDDRPFFENSSERPDPSELRIGVTMGFDGFGFTRSTFAAKHSSGALSLCIANLDTFMRYRPENLLLCGLTPGPKELTSDELQFFMRAFVCDLLQMYDHGILVKTPAFPEGRRVRVVLVAVCCDHPALCRMCGFADHASKKNFCTKCKIHRKDLNTKSGLTLDAFDPRIAKEHLEFGEMYKQLPPEEQDEFFKLHGSRYFELSRLPYFDPIRMTIVDPMHNILLGVIKTQWFDGWVKAGALREQTAKKLRELDQIHSMLRQFEMPSWVARLPTEVGAPAGGSLTSDEWKALAMVYGPLVIPFIWEEWQPVAEQEYQRKLAKWRDGERKRRARIAKGKRMSDGSEEPAEKRPTQRMHPSSADNFLNLAAGLKIILGRSIPRSDIPRARLLIQEYLWNFLEIHPDIVKPNFHYMTHIFDQIEDYGPVHGFWTYLFERLNKILKTYSVNNRDGGEIEVTFMREYSRTVQLRTLDQLNGLAGSDLVQDVPLDTGDRLVQECARLITNVHRDERGTLAALIQDVAQEASELTTRYSFGPTTQEELPAKLRQSLLSYYALKHPDEAISDPTAIVSDERSVNFLHGRINIHDHIIFDGHRISPASPNSKSPNSIIQVNFNHTRYVGEVNAIFTHRQPVHGSRTLMTSLLAVRWFSPLQDFDTSLWDPV
ncbi:hypothetical protein EUX98_g5001, partial [Antrodiella citrinella]